MEETSVCPWCHSEIVWDEEIGPEEYCPHCENELKAYRTMSIGLDEDDDEMMGDEPAGAAGRSGKLSGREVSDEDYGDLTDGFRHTNPKLLELEEKIESILDGQEEVPECPSCREYMLETGKQTIPEQGYEALTPHGFKQALLPGPFQVVWYVCPSCFHTHNRLSSHDRNALLSRLGVVLE